jgi:hypothetical protein
LAEWQQNELAGIDDIAYLIASHADIDGNSVEPAEIEAWQLEHGFEADALLIDQGQALMNTYTAANPGPNYTQAVTVIIDRDMVIHKVGGTYDTDHEANLQLLLDLVGP